MNRQTTVCWRDRRVQIVRWAVVGPAGALLPYALAAIIALFFGYDVAFEQLKSKLEFASVLPNKASSWLDLAAYLVPATTIAWLLAGRAGKSAAERLVDRFWASYDESLLAKVRDPDKRQAFDKFRPMPWIAPVGGTRSLTLDNLRASVLASANRSRADTFAQFGYMLLLGRPGIGKSRMAVEAARQLGQRDAVNGGNGAKLVRRDYWRRVRPFARLHAESLWDSGYVKIGQIEKLSQWKPNRPTLLLLDDPPPTISAKCIDALTRGMGGWRHPVRLLIINQTLPADLGMVEEKSVWRSELVGFSPLVAPIVLGDECLFSTAEVEKSIKAIFRGGSVPKGTNARQIRDACEGNPFLIELALNRILGGEVLGDLSSDALVDERVDRVFKGLEAAGLSPRNLPPILALATGTLAGAPCPAGPVLKAIPGSLIATDLLREAFPYQDVRDIDVSLPVVQPSPVGSRFVDRVVHMSSPSVTASMIVKAGWLANHFGMLRALLRGVPPGPLAEALMEIPVEMKDQVERFALIGTIIEASARREIPSRTVVNLLHQLSDTDAPALTAERVAELIAIGQRVMREPGTRGGPLAIAALTIAAISIEAEAIAGNVEGVRIALNAFADLACAATNRDVWLNDSEAALFIEQMTRLQDALSSILADPTLSPASIDAILGEAMMKLTAIEFDNEQLAFVLGRRMELMLESVHGETGRYFRALFSTFQTLSAGNLPAVHDREALAIGSRHASQSVRYTYRNFLNQCELVKDLGPPEAKDMFGAFIASLPEPDPDLPEHPTLVIAIAKTLKCTIFGWRHDPTCLAPILQRMDCFAALHQENVDVRRLQIISWRIAAFAWQSDSVRCTGAVQRVEALAREMPDTRGNRFNRVHAMRCLVQALRDERAKAFEVARYADHIAANYTHDRGLALERACLWMHASQACHDPNDFDETLGSLDRSLGAFQDDVEFIRLQASAYASAARVLQNVEPRLARQYAAHAFNLTSPFPGDVDLRHVRAGLRAYDFYLFDDTLPEATARLALLRDDLAWIRPQYEADGIARKLEELVQFELEALSFVASHSSYDLALCAAVIVDAERLHEQFSNSIIVARLFAHSLAALAWAEQRSGAADTALPKMRALLAWFPGDGEIQRAIENLSTQVGMQIDASERQLPEQSRSTTSSPD